MKGKFATRPQAVYTCGGDGKHEVVATVRVPASILLLNLRLITFCAAGMCARRDKEKQIKKRERSKSKRSCFRGALSS